MSLKSLFDLYISILLAIRMMMLTPTKSSVLMNVVELPKPNHAVGEYGIYMLRNIMANSAIKVTVPINWYLPSKYSGSLLFSFMKQS